MRIPTEMCINCEAKKIEFGDLFYSLIIYSDIRNLTINITLMIMKYNVLRFADV